MNTWWQAQLSHRIYVWWAGERGLLLFLLLLKKSTAVQVGSGRGRGERRFFSSKMSKVL